MANTPTFYLCINCRKNITLSGSNFCGTCILTICQKCGINQVTPGRTWCKYCFNASRINKYIVPSAIETQCSRCHFNKANIGYDLCQSCFNLLRGSTLFIPTQQSYIPTQVCLNCHSDMAVPSGLWCMQCLESLKVQKKNVPILCIRCKTMPVYPGLNVCSECYYK